MRLDNNLAIETSHWSPSMLTLLSSMYYRHKCFPWATAHQQLKHLTRLSSARARHTSVVAWEQQIWILAKLKKKCIYCSVGHSLYAHEHSWWLKPSLFVLDFVLQGWVLQCILTSLLNWQGAQPTVSICFTKLGACTTVIITKM